MKLLATLALTVMLSGCGWQSPLELTPETPSTPEDALSLSTPTKLDPNKHLAYVDQGQLFVTHVEQPFSQALTALNTDQLPIGTGLFEIRISPSGHHLVWYAPQSGIVAYDLEDDRISLLAPRSSWLERNPYGEFHPSDDRYYYIDDNGNSLIEYVLHQGVSRKIAIPFPYGNTFRISPDGNWIVFVASFEQAESSVTYLLSRLDGSAPTQIAVDTPPSRREEVAWMPTSTGVLYISSTTSIGQMKPSGENNPLWYTHQEPGELVKLWRPDSIAYYQTTTNKLYGVDTNSAQKAARIPFEIAEELHRPEFVPWHNNQILILETLRPTPEQFQRLWSSSFMGVKKLLIEDFNTITISQPTLEL